MNITEIGVYDFNDTEHNDDDGLHQKIAIYGDYVVVGRRRNVTLHYSDTMTKVRDLHSKTDAEWGSYRGPNPAYLHRLVPGERSDDGYLGCAVAINSTHAFFGWANFDQDLEGLIYTHNLHTNVNDDVTGWDDNNPRGLGKSIAVTENHILSGCEGISPHRCGAELIQINNDGSLGTLEEKGYNFNYNYGYSVALYDVVAIVGEYGAERVIVFDNIVNAINRNGKEGSRIHPDGNYIYDPSVETDTEFGYSVALEGSNLIVGAPGSNKIYLYDISTPDAPRTTIVENGRFGHSVSIHDNIVVVGAPTSSVNGMTDVGKVFVYKCENDTMEPIYTEGYIIEGNNAGQRFGNSVSVHGGKIAIYSKTAAYVYDLYGIEIIGDPYIKPMYGPLYKLPDVDAFYRILEGENVIINAQVQVVQQEYINHHAKMINDRFFKDVSSNVYDWDSMYFFTQLCIHYDDEIAIYNMLNTDLLTECPAWLSMKVINKKTESSAMYENEDVLKVVELSIENTLTIQAALYNNPQILTGIKVKSCKAKLNGLLMYKYSSESAAVESLYDTSKCNFKDAENCKVVTEYFYTNNGVSESREITIV